MTLYVVIVSTNLVKDRRAHYDILRVERSGYVSAVRRASSIRHINSEVSEQQ